MKVYCFDIDGTLCTDTDGADRNANPRVARIAQVNRLHAAGHTIHVYTAPGFSPDNPVLRANLDHKPMPFPRKSFDIVLSKSVIEHTRTTGVLLKRVFDALRPSGTAIIIPPSWRHTYWGQFYCDHTHVTPFTALTPNDALALAGLTNIDVQHFFQLPFLWRYPKLKPLIHFIGKLPIPFRPHLRAPWPKGLNKFIRLSNKIMLLAVATKPKQGNY